MFIFKLLRFCIMLKEVGIIGSVGGEGDAFCAGVAVGEPGSGGGFQFYGL